MTRLRSLGRDLCERSRGRGQTQGSFPRVILLIRLVHHAPAGFDQVRGVAYDPAGHRLFFVEHGKAGHALHVLALP